MLPRPNSGRRLPGAGCLSARKTLSFRVGRHDPKTFEGAELSRLKLPLTYAATCGFLALAGGCKLLATPALLWGKEPTKSVPAEYPYLQGKKVLILVWADPETLFEYPWVQLELSEHAAAAMKPNIPGINFVPNRSVYDYQRAEPDWDRADPAVIGSRFGASRVLLIELTQYTTREPESPHLYRGRIAANVKVHDAAYKNSSPSYRTAVETAYPPESAGEWGTDDVGIRKATMEAFALDLAGKFFDRQVKVK